MPCRFESIRSDINAICQRIIDAASDAPGVTVSVAIQCGSGSVFVTIRKDDKDSRVSVTTQEAWSIPEEISQAMAVKASSCGSSCGCK